MTLTHEDLHAIKGIVDESVKSGINGLEKRIGSLEDRLDGVDVRFDGIDTRLDGIDTRLDGMQLDIKKLQDEVHYIKVVQLENGALKTLDDIDKKYSDTYERYRAGADKFDKAFSDIDNLQKVVTDHSKMIQELQLKQA